MIELLTAKASELRKRYGKSVQVKFEANAYDHRTDGSVCGECGIMVIGCDVYVTGPSLEKLEAKCDEAMKPESVLSRAEALEKQAAELRAQVNQPAQLCERMEGK